MGRVGQHLIAMCNPNVTLGGTRSVPVITDDLVNRNHGEGWHEK